MSGFSGINQFGNLTTSSGQKLTFEDFDKNKDGEVTKAEYEEVMKEMQLDSVELSTVDKDGDGAVSEDEFAIWEQKTQMQELVNNVLTELSKDPKFSGKTEYINEIISSLKSYINDYAENYTKDVSQMAANFELALPTKVEELKSEVLANDPETVKSDVLDEMYDELMQDDSITTKTVTKKTAFVQREYIEDIDPEIVQSVVSGLLKSLETEATNFINSYTGDNLKSDLKAHLEEYMSRSDYDKMSDAISELNEGIETLGSYIDNSGDLVKLKEYAREFLLAAINNGVNVKLAGSNIKTEAAINTALNKYTDSATLRSALEEIIAGFSTENLKATVLSDETKKAEEAEQAAFAAVKGSDCTVDPALIDYSDVSGYFDGTKLTTKGKDGHDDRIREQAKEIIEESSIKEQMKQQIEEMLQAKGISFDMMESIFENVYNDSLTQTLEAITSRKTNNKWLNKNKRYASNQDIKTIVDNFINNFNTNITAAIDEMNASNTDFDIQDLDYSQVDDLVESGDVKTETRGFKAEDRITENANILCDRMKSQLLRKAQAMCTANGIAFDNKVFTTMFNNAKNTAVSSSITTVDILFGVLAKLDQEILMDTLVNEFKTNYTNWVNAEKEDV